MRFHILTLFPDMVSQALHTSILGRAVKKGLIGINTVDIRDYTQDKNRRVDDYTYGGGAGMLIQAQPVFDAWRDVAERAGYGSSAGRRIRTVYLTPQGRLFNQELAEELSKEEELIFLCGHYEGIDERVLEEIVTDSVSVGDYVLTGGELPAMVMVDAIARLVPGVLNNDRSAETESFHGSLLEYPQYSRPVCWQGREVPEVLLSGNHKKIRQWRLEEAVRRTRERRPDLYARYIREQNCIERLLRSKLLHIDMIELLRRGQAQILYDGEEGVLLRDRVSGNYMITAEGEQEGRVILRQTCREINRRQKPEDLLFAVHQESVKSAAEEILGMETFLCCRHAVYTRKEPLPAAWYGSRMPDEFEIRALSLEHLDTVAAQYHLADRKYLQGRISRGCMYGAFAGECLEGFIGIHEEGSIGMLEVSADCRRKGIGRALEAYMINLFLEQGLTPYGQVSTDNQASGEMQEKLGLHFSRGEIYWLRGRTPDV
ncbi:MAG: tRNA (guanosine(37)-N1)-methyltransferase TrmD [Lachnospiraceae bacterium]|nr:tRNA (guanosine(37)-N1)-methyltransferase TrmD [Lachnospiraceae bacterium]